MEMMQARLTALEPLTGHLLTPGLLAVNCVKFHERLLHCLITQINIFMTCKHYLLYFSRKDVFEFPLRQQGMTLETHQVATPSLAPTRTHSDQLLRNGWLQSTLHTLIQQPLHHRWALWMHGPTTTGQIQVQNFLRQAAKTEQSLDLNF